MVPEGGHICRRFHAKDFVGLFGIGYQYAVDAGAVRL